MTQFQALDMTDNLLTRAAGERIGLDLPRLETDGGASSASTTGRDIEYDQLAFT